MKKEVNLCTIHYASRTLTEAEKNYAACERETLAVIFALKNFRVCDLLTQVIHLSKDHQTLQYAFKENYVQDILVLLFDILAEYK